MARAKKGSLKDDNNGGPRDTKKGNHRVPTVGSKRFSLFGNPFEEPFGRDSPLKSLKEKSLKRENFLEPTVQWLMDLHRGNVERLGENSRVVC